MGGVGAGSYIYVSLDSGLESHKEEGRVQATCRQDAERDGRRWAVGGAGAGEPPTGHLRSSLSSFLLISLAYLSCQLIAPL